MLGEQSAHLCVLIKQLLDLGRTEMNSVVSHATRLLLTSPELSLRPS